MKGSVRAASAPRREPVLLEITGLATGGEAVGRQIGGAADGRITFVLFAAPGERVRASVIKEKARLAWAELESIEQDSPERTEAPCPLFRRCGGCQWQHVTRAAQLDAKKKIIQRAVGRLDELRAVGPPYGYRDRARLTVGRAGVVGFHGLRSREVVDVERCLLLGPALAEALPAVRAEARSAPPGTEVAMAAGDQVAVAIGSRLMQVQGSHLSPLPPEATVDLAEPGSAPLRVPPGAFAQVGAAANAALVAAVLDAVGPAPGRVLELHAGSGNFTRHLVASGATVVASDGDPAAVARGQRNVPGADWRVAGALPSVAGPVDTVLVDPPRTGLDEAALALASAGQRLVYVSCDPQTLGRDVARLVESGFTLERVVGLDLMPQTYHVEVVATLRRR
jgi:23S rRNA (uracil1939-C5)-methyltransferase